MKINEVEEEIVKDFEEIDDLEVRYDYIMDLGKKLPPLSDEFKTEEYLVKGCQSQVWVRPKIENDKLYFEADSNTAIAKGVVSLLVRVYSGHTPLEIAKHELTLLERIHLRSLLTSQRSNGLTAMINKIKAYAIALVDKSSL